MEQLQILKRKVDGTKDMQSVVKTMQSLAAVNIRQYEKASQSVSEYSRAIELAFQILMRDMPEGVNLGEQSKPDRYGVIVFGSSQGLSGDFNERMVSYSLGKMEEISGSGEYSVLAMGERIAGSLETEGVEVDERLPISGSFGDITPAVQQIVVIIEGWRQRKGVDSVLVFHNQRKGGSSFEPKQVKLFPIDYSWLKELRDRPWESNSLPMFTMDWNRLFSSLIKQYFSVTLYRAFFKSLEAENASRLAAMQAAEKNIEDRLEELTVRFNQQRQQSITSELLDIVAGFEALTN